MGNTWLNIRFGEWHFKILRDFPYISVSYNSFHAEERKENPNWKWYQRYK